MGSRYSRQIPHRHRGNHNHIRGDVCELCALRGPFYDLYPRILPPHLGHDDIYDAKDKVPFHLTLHLDVSCDGILRKTSHDAPLLWARLNQKYHPPRLHGTREGLAHPLYLRIFVSQSDALIYLDYHTFYRRRNAHEGCVDGGCCGDGRCPSQLFHQHGAYRGDLRQALHIRPYNNPHDGQHIPIVCDQLKSSGSRQHALNQDGSLRKRHAQEESRLSLPLSDVV